MHVEFNWQTLMRKQCCFNHNPLPYTFAIHKNEIQNKKKGYEPGHNKTSHKTPGALATLTVVAASIEARVACVSDGL